jgi:hypothetical protein
LFYELLDQWTAYHNATHELRSRVTELFANIANGGSTNPNLGVLAMLESMEKSEKRLQEKMDELMSSIDG